MCLLFAEFGASAFVFVLTLTKLDSENGRLVEYNTDRVKQSTLVEVAVDTYLWLGRYTFSKWAFACSLVCG